MIYLDNASTMKPLDEIIKDIVELQTDFYFNPSSNYAFKEKKLLKKSKETISKILNVNPNRLFFTSCATESNNWVLKNVKKTHKNNNIIISNLEHPSVYNVAKSLPNVEIRVVNSINGKIEVKDLIKLIDENTILVSIVHLCSVTGNLNDIYELSKSVKNINKNILFHTDATQSFCKFEINSSYIDFITISAHKIGGLKGIGALYINEEIKLPPLLRGGKQELNMRAGTENLLSIVSFSKACEYFKDNYDKEKMQTFYEILSNELNNKTIITTNQYSNIVCIAFKNIKAEILQTLLAEQEIYIGIGSACSGNELRYFDRLSKDEYEGIIRISFSLDTTKNEVIQATNLINKLVEKIIKRKI